MSKYMKLNVDKAPIRSEELIHILSFDNNLKRIYISSYTSNVAIPPN